MSLAENLLNELDSPLETMATSGDSQEPHIVVNENRQIIVPDKLKLIAVTGDKNVETVTIDCVRYWDEHDLSTFAIYINYTLPDGTNGTYIPSVTTPSDAQDKIFSFTWTIERSLTSKAGALEFLILARQTDADGEIAHQWSSLPNSECAIARGNDDVTIPEAVQEQSDALTKLLQDSKDAIDRATNAADAAIIEAQINANGELVLTKGDTTTVNLGRVKGDKGDTYTLTDIDKKNIANLVLTDLTLAGEVSV